MTDEQLQAIEEQHGKLVRFFDITKNELNSMVTWNPDTPVDEFWEMFGAAQMGLEDTQRLLDEVRQLRAKLDAVPVDDITFLWRFAPRNSASLRACGKVGDWLSTVGKAVQP
jgi:hypothetical protein